MDSNNVNMYLTSNQKYFEASKLPIIKEKMLRASEANFGAVTAVDLKDPTTILLMSIFLGAFGVDRFMLGDSGMGILKLLTGGLCGVLIIIDWFIVSKKAKELNYRNIMMVL